MEEEKIPEKLSKGVSTISLTAREKKVFTALGTVLYALAKLQEQKECMIHINVAGAWFLQDEKFLQEMLELYESAVGDPSSKGPVRIERFPPPFQAVPCNPIVLDIAYNSIEFPSLENRIKKDKKGIFSRLWG